MEIDIRKLMEVTVDSQLLSTNETTCTNRGLINFVTGANVEPEVAHDILTARVMGQKDYEVAVQYYFLKVPSVKFQKRKRKLLKFTTTTKKKHKQSPVEQEQKQSPSALKELLHEQANTRRIQTALECNS